MSLPLRWLSLGFCGAQATLPWIIVPSWLVVGWLLLVMYVFRGTPRADQLPLRCSSFQNGRALWLGLAVGFLHVPRMDTRPTITGTLRGPWRCTDVCLATIESERGISFWLLDAARGSELQAGSTLTMSGPQAGRRMLSNPGQPRPAPRPRVRVAEHITIGASTWTAWAAGDKWAKRASELFPSSRAGALTRGLVLGDQSDIPTSALFDWRDLGVLHLLSVSGSHLAIIAWLLTAVGVWGIAALGIFRSRPARWVAAVPSVLVVASYAAATGAAAPTVRALIVFALFAWGQASGRSVRLLDALAVAALLIVWSDPFVIWTASFQLSFAATGVLAGMRRGALWSTMMKASIRITLATAPLSAFWFGEIAWGGVIGNVLAWPLEVLALPIALIGTALSNDRLIHAATWLVDLIDAVVHSSAPWLPAWRVDSWIVPTCLAVGLMLAWCVGRGRSAALLAFAIVGALAYFRAVAPAVIFLDVGQGDATLIVAPTQTWLIDAGGHAGTDLPQASYTGRVVANAMRYWGRRRLDVAILSHPHPDHYLGFFWLARHIPIVRFWRSAAANESACRGKACLATVETELRRRGTRLGSPPLDVPWVDHGFSLTAVAPRFSSTREALAASDDPVWTTNNNSLVIDLRMKSRTVLFLGDLEEEGELALLPHGPVDVVKVAHHGSRTSSHPEIVNALRPRCAVFSLGFANRFAFPAPEVVARWQTAGASTWMTGYQGALRLGALKAIGHDPRGQCPPF